MLNNVKVNMNHRVPNKNADLMKKISWMGTEVTGHPLKMLQASSFNENPSFVLATMMRLASSNIFTDILVCLSTAQFALH